MAAGARSVHSVWSILNGTNKRFRPIDTNARHAVPRRDGPDRPTSKTSLSCGLSCVCLGLGLEIAAETTRRTANLLARYAFSTRRRSLHEHNRNPQGAVAHARACSREHVSLVSDAGTLPDFPTPDKHLIRRAIDEGILVENRFPRTRAPSSLRLGGPGFATQPFRPSLDFPHRSKTETLLATLLVEKGGRPRSYSLLLRILLQVSWGRLKIF